MPVIEKKSSFNISEQFQWPFQCYREGCHSENGYCEEPDTCLCKTGWEGESCDECVPYWFCPASGTCNEPNQCICGSGVADNGYCNREIINGNLNYISPVSPVVKNRVITIRLFFFLNLGPRFDSFGECSNPCKSNPAIESALGLAPGTRVSTCRWNDNGPCDDRSETCNGSRDWIVQQEGESDPEKCIYVSAGQK